MRTTKIGTCTLVAATLLMSLTNCSKENGFETSSANQFSVTLNFKSPTTRADGTAALGGTTMDIVDGYICFVTAGGAITEVYTISSSSTAGKNINAATLGSTPVTLENVPGTSSRVYLLANKGSLSATPVEGMNISTYLTNYMKVVDQGNYTQVTSLGDAPLLPGATIDDRNAAITLSTQLSRIQIEALGFDNNITGTVSGIFINGFYPTMQLNGTTDARLTTTLSTDYNENSSIFLTEYKGYVYDIVDKVITQSVTPNNHVWGYNLFSSVTPQIVIKLTNVVVDGDVVLSDPQFVTLNGFKKTDDTPITHLEGGMIYTIKTDAIVIKYENITPVPGVTPMNVHVTVTPVTWQETIVNPIM